MSSIVEKLLRESSKSDIKSLSSMSMGYLLEATDSDEKKVDTAMQKTAKSLRSLNSGMKKRMPETSALLVKAGANMTKAVAAGENDEEAAALFSLSNQFGASLLGLLNSIQNALETEGGSKNKSVATTLGGEDELKKIIEKTFKPSTTSVSLIQKANDLVAKAKDITATGASSEGADAEGRNEPESIFEIEDVKEIDEGIFANIGNFLKGLFKKVPTDARGTIKSLMPLFGGGNIAKALLNDLKGEKMTGAKFTALLRDIKPALEDLAPGSESLSAAPTSGADDASSAKSGAKVASENPEVARGTASAIEKALGDRGSAAASAVRDIAGGADPKAAVSGLSDEDRAILKGILTRLGGAGSDAKPADIASAVAKDVPAAGTGEIKYGKYIDSDKVKNIAGDKGPKAVSDLLDKSPELRKKLGINDSKKRHGALVSESMYSLIFEELDADVIKAFKDGLTKDVIGKELSDDEAKEIAQSVIDKSGTTAGTKEPEESLSSLLFVQKDPKKKNKGFKVREKPSDKARVIINNLQNLTNQKGNGSWERVKSDPDYQQRKAFVKNLQDLKKSLDGVKLESREDDSDTILERWQALAGLKG